MGDIYGSKPWYHERPEPEEEFEGLLIGAAPAPGSGEERSLGFVLATYRGKYPVYAAGREGEAHPSRRLATPRPWQARQPPRRGLRRGAVDRHRGGRVTLGAHPDLALGRVRPPSGPFERS